MKKSELARIAREEHEFRESLRRKKAKLRRGRAGPKIPRSLRARRTSGKRERNQ